MKYLFLGIKNIKSIVLSFHILVKQEHGYLTRWHFSQNIVRLEIFFKIRYYLTKVKEMAPWLVYDTNFIVALILNILNEEEIDEKIL